MKYREILLNQLKLQPYFDKRAISQLSEQFNLKSTTIDSYISRSLKCKDIFQLKKGLYIPADFYFKNKDNTSYLFFLANIIRKPSYVSSWTALQYYNLVTEAIHTIISVTPKVTRNQKTKIGAFSYQSIKEDLFSGFSLEKDKFEFFIATPAKALFDLLYFKTRQFRGLKFKDIHLLIKELRIDIEEMDKAELEKFYLMIKDYLEYE
ncbi:MAG: hypothetical protein ABH830_04350 [Patescibacteria group bacterium]